MSWIGDYTYQGLDAVRIKFGEGAYRFFLRLGRSKPKSSSETGRLNEIGRLAGLNAAETAAAATAAKSAITLPLWAKILLCGFAIVAGTLVLNYYTRYIPGTLYASIKPNDFLMNS